MASACKRFISRTSLPSIKSAFKSNAQSASVNSRSATSTSPRFPFPPTATSNRLRRFSSRSPVELGGVQSLLPLHSVVAAARMTSCLSTTSRSCRALSQGTLCCTSPGL